MNQQKKTQQEDGKKVVERERELFGICDFNHDATVTFTTI